MKERTGENSRTRGRSGSMAEDKYDVLGPIFADIGGELADIVGGDPNGTYLYAEAGEGWVGYGIFKDEGNAVRYFDGNPELGDLILKAWKVEIADKRWVAMEYEIKGTQFDVDFQFPDEIDPKESEMQRRPRALERRFGDKPVIYPPRPQQ